MKLAQYKSIQHGYTTELEYRDDGCWDDSYIQISEPVEIEFTPLQPDVVVKKEVAAIDGLIEKVQVAAQVQINSFEQRKAELLALPDMRQDI